MTPAPFDSRSLAQGERGEWTAEEIERFWWRPQVNRWVPVVVMLATVVTLAIVVLLADLAWKQVELVGRPSARTEVGAVLGGVGAVALLAWSWTWRYRDVSPWARAAVALVCVHVAIAAGAWALSSRLRTPERELPLLSALPAPAIAFAAGLLLFVAAAIHGRRRRPTGAPGWLRGAVVFSLSFLLLFGIWLPVIVPDHSRDFWTYGVITDFRLRLTLIPPAALALAIAAITVVRPRWLRSLWLPAVVTVCALLVGAMAARDDASITALAVYANYVHVLFAAGWLALCSLAALAWTHARALRANRADTARPAPWVQRGVVEASSGHPVVGAWHVEGWLAGLRTSLDGFTLRTVRGDALPVPHGACLVAPMPASSAGAEPGERLAALRAGDEVIVSGFVAAASDGPYRTGGLPVPGSGGLVVTARRRRDDSIGRDVVLLLYRPCVLFLIFAALAALPGIVGNQAEPDRLDRYDDRSH